MTTAELKNDQLSNNRLEVFKSNTKLVKASDGLFNCNLNLTDGSCIDIPMREDGYINATMLCKASLVCKGKEKKFNDWFRLQNTKELIIALENDKNLNAGIPVFKSIEVTKGKYGGSWIHPDLAIQLAQWLSPHFAIQVSRWTRELLLFDKVEIGNEKSSEELDNKLQEQIKQLTNENKELTHNYTKLRQIHNSLKFKRNYHQLEVGDCVYVCHNRLEPPNRFKIGKTNNINHTLKIYRRIAPYVLLDFLFFTTKMSLLEDILLTKYKDERRPINHELVEDIALETIIQDINLIINLIKIPGSVGSAESIDIYNKDINTPDVYACIIEEDEEEEINILIENRVELLEEEAELIDERIEEVVTIADERLAKVEARVQVIEETQKQEYMTLLKEMENYTEAKLKEWLVKLRLSVTGNKTVKKQKITEHLKKISIVLEDIDYKQYRECDTCKESKLLNINNYRKFVYGYNNMCIVCDLKSCERVVKLREDIKTEITETTYTGVCSNCKNVVALDDFFKNKANPSGRDSQCKNCSIKGKNIRNNDGVLKPMRKINKKVICDDDHKHCIECDMIKSKEEFLKSASRKDGYQTYCKNCDTTRNRKNRMLRKLNGTKKID